MAIDHLDLLPEQSSIPPGPHAPAFFIPEYFSLWTCVRLSSTLSTMNSYCASDCAVFWNRLAGPGLHPYLDNSYPVTDIILPVLNVQICPVTHRVTHIQLLHIQILRVSTCSNFPKEKQPTENKGTFPLPSGENLECAGSSLFIWFLADTYDLPCCWGLLKYFRVSLSVG